jgi:hypothetical protein
LDEGKITQRVSHVHYMIYHIIMRLLTLIFSGKLNSICPLLFPPRHYMGHQAETQHPPTTSKSGNGQQQLKDVMDRELSRISTHWQQTTLPFIQISTSSDTESAVPQGSPGCYQAGCRRHVKSIDLSDSDDDAPLAATKPKRRRRNQTP